MPKRRDALEPINDIPDVLASRPKPKPKRSRAWDAKRSKATYDLPADLVDRVKRIAEELSGEYANTSVRVSDVARILLEAGIAAYDAGSVKIEPQPVAYRLDRKE